MKAYIHLFKMKVSRGRYVELLHQILNLHDKSSYVCIANVHMLTEAYRTDSFLSVVNEADIVTSDGMPLTKAMKWLYGIEQERVAGMDLMPDLMRHAAEKKMSIFLYGSTDDVLQKILDRAVRDFPGLKIEAYSPPFKALIEHEKQEIIDNINRVNPDFIFVALGCPKQEKWMAEHKGKIHGCMIGLGGAFEVYAGTKDRAPKWMQESSLEWLYRLIQDPRRLWKRYFVTNTLFIILLIGQFVKIRLFNKKK